MKLIAKIAASLGLLAVSSLALANEDCSYNQTNDSDPDSNEIITSAHESCLQPEHFGNQGSYNGNGGGGRGPAPNQQPQPDNHGVDPCSQAAVSDPSTDNPVNISSGTKQKLETDFSVVGDVNSGLELQRIYNQSQPLPGIFGPYWGSTFDSRLGFKETTGVACTIVPGTGAGSCTGGADPNLSVVYLYRGDGAQFSYTYNSSLQQWTNAHGESSAYMVYSSATNQWSFHDEDGSVLTFSSVGRLLSKVDKFGIGWTLQYTEPYLLQSVTHTSGKTIQFHWTGHTVTSVVDPGSSTYSYSYNSGGYLTGVTYPGSPSHSKSYLYEVSGKPYLLTGISIDGVRYSQYSYLSNGQVQYSGLGTGGYIQKATFSYSAQSTTVTTADGATDVYAYGTGNGVTRLTSVSQSAVTGCPNAAQSIVYDSNGGIQSVLDWNGNKTTYTYAANGRLLNKTTGINTAFPGEERYTAYTWADSTRLGSITRYGANTSQPIEEIDYNYYPTGSSASGRISSIVKHNLNGYGTAGQTQTTSYSYTFYSSGIPASMAVDGPLAGTADTTTYRYDSVGNLTSITNALNQVTTFSSYTGLGKPQTVTDPNSVVTKFTYDYNGRPTSVTKVVNGSNVVTTLSYDGLGHVKTILYPEGRTVTYTYESSGALTQMADSSSSSTTGSGKEVTQTNSYMGFGRDIEDNLASINIGTTTVQTCAPGDDGCVAGTTNSQNFLKRWSYDQLGRPLTETILSQVSNFSYDPNGNLLTAKDALNRQHSYTYDGNNQRLSDTDPLNNFSTYGYDAAGHLTRVTDARSNSTLYQYDGLGNLVSQTSPDTGQSTYSYDSAGRLQTITRADNSTVNYTWDSLNRLAQVSASGQLINYGYDSCSGGVGKLCQITDSSGSTSYTYNSFGQLATQVSVVGSTSYTIGYNYDALGRLAEIAYPGGNKVDYNYTIAGYYYGDSSGFEGRVVGVTAVIGGVSTVLARIYYSPYGPISSILYGNGFGNTETRDTAYRLTNQNTFGLTNVSYAYNAGRELTNITDNLSSSQSETFTYDAVSRVKTAVSVLGSDAYTWDANGNRLTATWEGNSDTFTIPSSSNRISGIGGSHPQSFQYTAMGDISSACCWTPFANFTATYDGLSRMATYTPNGGSTTQYSYNGLNKRVKKSGPNGTYSYIYSADGSLLGETGNGSSTLTSQYVWLNGLPIALIRNGQIYYIHTDQTGRPTAITNSAKTVVWKSSGTAFYSAVTLDNIGGFNLAYPGQYYDMESTFYYNGRRYYDFATGRYLQSDPIGLAGGNNTYAYVGGNPISFIDPMGLAACGCQSAAADFASNFKDDFNTTNGFFFSFPTSLSRTGIGIALGSANVVANASGGVTLVQALASVPGGGIAFYGGVGGTLLAGGVGFVANAAVVTGSLEAGITIGSALNAAVQTAADQLSCQ